MTHERTLYLSSLTLNFESCRTGPRVKKEMRFIAVTIDFKFIFLVKKVAIFVLNLFCVQRNNKIKKLGNYNWHKSSFLTVFCSVLFCCVMVCFILFYFILLHVTLSLYNTSNDILMHFHVFLFSTCLLVIYFFIFDLYVLFVWFFVFYYVLFLSNCYTSLSFYDVIPHHTTSLSFI